ncbi:Toll/interleukin-1 receptor domain-containing protein, partial [Tanacetum coccineum]
SEVNFISKVIDTIDCTLDRKLVCTASNLTGIEVRAKAINSWLKSEQSGDNFLAICGMGGGGKTTLAQHIYNSNKHSFDASSFLQDIRRDEKQPNDFLGLQKKLLTDILGYKNITISNVCEGTRKIEDALQMKKVLIILDDIVEDDDLADLLGTKAFYTQSKIIITTRRLDISAWFGFKSWRCRVHKLELLNDYESLTLFCYHAFGSKIPMEGFEDLAIELAGYCEGNPLALKVLGSSLFVSVKDTWTRTSMIEVWRSRENSLNSFKGDLDSKVQGVLKKSFDSLPLSSHRELFLHIACFFVGEYENEVVAILDDDYHAKFGIMTLINRCLLTVSTGGTLPRKLIMHQLLQDMGRKIVYEESKDPAKRSRVWHDDESYRLLSKRHGSDTIEGLALDMQKVDQRMRSEVDVFRTAGISNYGV